MSSNILIAYATTDGHTLEICRRLQRIAEGKDHKVTLHELQAADGLDLSAFDRIVIGASIRYGKHKPEVKEFIDKNQAVLESRPSAFFSVNVVARKPGKQTVETNPYVRKFLARISWKPPLVGIFAGKIDYPAYGAFDRTMIRFILWMGKGPTDPTGTFEFTDWKSVDAFGEKISQTPA